MKVSSNKGFIDITETSDDRVGGGYVYNVPRPEEVNFLQFFVNEIAVYLRRGSGETEKLSAQLFCAGKK